MVVMRSPKQGQSQRRGSSVQASAIASTSPLKMEQRTLLFEAQDGDRSGATPRKKGESHNSLERRIAETLESISASPNAKANAPWPFASSSKLKRSPPVSKLRAPAPSLLSAGVFDAPDPAGSTSDASNLPRHASVASPQPANNVVVDKRNFEVAARALFAGRKGLAKKGRHSMPGGLTSLEPFATGPRKPLRARSSRSDLRLERSIAILATPARQAQARLQASTDVSSDNLAPSLSGDSPQSVKTLAKIGRLTARLAHLEAENATAKSEVDALRAKHEQLAKRYSEEKEEKVSMQSRLDEYADVSGQCTDLIDRHEQLENKAKDLEQQLEVDAQKIVDLQASHAKLRYKERKLRYELGSRRQEGKWQEETDHHDDVEAQRLAVIAVNAQNIDLELRLEEAVAQKEYEKLTAHLLREQVTQLAQQQKTGSMDDQVLKRALEEQVAKHHQERTDLISRLDTAIRDREQAEKLSKGLTREVKVFEERAARDKERHKELIAAKGTIKELEKEVKDLQREKDKLSADQGETEASLKEKEADLKISQAKAKELDKKLKASEKERQDLQNGVDVQHRAIKALSSPPRSVTASPQEPAKVTMTKRKRPAALEEDDAAEGADEVPPVEKKKARTTGKTAAATRHAKEEVTAQPEVASGSEEEAVVEPPKWKRGRPPKKAKPSPIAEAAKKPAAKAKAKAVSPPPAAESDAEAASDEEVEEELIQRKAKTPAARSKTLAEKDDNRAAADTTAKNQSVTSKSDKASTGKRKLNTGNKSIFTWGGSATGGGGGASLLGLPEVLSPVKRT